MSKPDQDKKTKKGHSAEEIQKKEESIAHMTVRINELEKQLESSEREAIRLIKDWIKNPLPEAEGEADKKKKERLAMIKELNKKEEESEGEYIRLRKEKDNLIQELRLCYIQAIKEFHQASKDKNEKKINKTEMNKKIPLETSSLLTGTSMGGLDGGDYSKLFKQFDLDDDKIDYEKFPVKKEYSCPRRGDVPISTIRFYEMMGKEVIIKEFDRKISTDITSQLEATYRDLKQIQGHRSLISIIGILNKDKNKDDPLRFVFERASINYDRPPSLKNVLLDETDPLPISFLKKLNIAKSIVDAMAWLQETDGRLHYRLKPSNVLFTKDWKVKLSDYGIGLPNYFDESQNKKIWFETSQVHYTAPEILEDPNSLKGMTLEGYKKNSDVWSFGLILLAMLTEKEHTCDKSDKDFDDVKARVLKFKFSPDMLSAFASDTLVKLLGKCLANHERIEFSKITNMLGEGTDIWEKIITETAAKGSKEMENILIKVTSKYAPTDNKELVKWTQLKQVLLPGKHQTEEAKKIVQCTQYFLGVPTATIIADQDHTFKVKSVLSVLGIVKPFVLGDFGQFCLELVQKKWYFGLLERNDTEAYLQENINNDEKARPFLVRNSERAGFQFIFVSKVPAKGGGEVWEHLALDPEWYQDKGVIKYIEEDLAKQRKVHPVAFTKKVDKRPQANILSGLQLLEAQTTNIRLNRGGAQGTWGTMSATKGSRTIT